MNRATGYWAGRKVVVTGGAGMIGAALVRKLVDLGADVLVLDDFSRGRTRVWPARYVMADAGSVGVCQHTFHGADAVFNLAASVAGVFYNRSHQLHMLWSNLRLQLVPLMVATELDIERFLQVSSVCVYSPRFNHPCQEANGLRDQPHPDNAGYAWSKRIGEMAVHWSGDRAVIVRPSNTYGPGDYFDGRSHVVPALIRRCLEDEEIEVYGSPDVVREFVYVDDVAEGMLKAAERGRPGHAYNIGSDGETRISIGGLVRLIQRLTKAESKRVIWKAEGGGENQRWSDCSKALEELGWRYETSLTEGLQRTIEWYRNASAGSNVR